MDEACQWSVGFDWVWHESSNSVAFLNSFKMKTSIIIGVIHMTVGIMLKGINSIYFGKWSKFFFVFLPELLFFLATFGYMCVLIIMKWLTRYEDSSKAPSIISVFINFVTGYLNNLQSRRTSCWICIIPDISSNFPCISRSYLCAYHVICPSDYSLDQRKEQK